VIELKVHGSPAPQGSMRSIGKGRMVGDNPRTKVWREQVVSEVLRCGLENTQLEGPLRFHATFYHHRLKMHYRRLNGQDVLKGDAPIFVAATPDIDKVCRATLDALTQSGLIKDDKFIAILQAAQRYSNDNFEGAYIQIGPIDHA
jgi:Holliday junction resolvase RusA-like endonuclease